MAGVRIGVAGTREYVELGRTFDDDDAAVDIRLLKAAADVLGLEADADILLFL